MLSGWSYRKKITQNSAEIDSDLSSFTVYVDLTNLDADFWSHVKDGGGDIRVTTDDGDTEVPIDLVSCATSGDTGELHFKGDLLDASDVDFYLYYGNAGASGYAADDALGAENVWDSDFVFVHHMNEASDSQVVDSTSNDNDSSAQSFNTDTGKIVEGADFIPANNDRITLPDSASLDVSTGITLSAWVNFGTVGNGAKLLYRDDVGANRIFQWYLAGASDMQFLLSTVSTVFDINITTSSAGLSTGTWYYIVAKYDSVGNAARVMVDTVSRGTDTATGGTKTVRTGAEEVYIGADLGNTNEFDGIMDEVRMSGILRTDDWSAAEYSNQNTPETFYTEGGEEELSSFIPKITVI